MSTVGCFGMESCVGYGSGIIGYSVVTDMIGWFCWWNDDTSVVC
ncbi:hypothetical protein Hanom_Chr13g01235061 [Helianthus anomalus]